MTWSAVGSFTGSSNAAPTYTSSTVGNLRVLEIINFSNSTVWASSVSGGGCTWTAAGVKFSGTTNAFSAAVFLGTVTATGSQTPSITWSGTAPASFGTATQEFHSTTGAWAFDKQGNLDVASGSAWPSLTAANGAGELYFGYSANTGSATAGSTSGYVYNQNVDTTGDGAAYNVSCPATATSPTWGDSTEVFGIAVMVAETAQPAQPPPPVPLPQLPPGWFPGADRATAVPGGVPFAPLPGTTDAAPAVVIPPTPEAAPVRPLPPGWFPGSEAVTAGPGAIPFQPEPVPLTATPAVVFPVPEAAGIPDWLPLPPGWFPGAALVTTDPGSIPFYSYPLPQTPPPAPLGPPVITGLAGGGTGYFIDQYGNPRLVWGDAAWALPGNAGRWNSGNWRGDFDGYLAARAAQGCTVIYAKPIGTVQSGNIDNNGSTFDSLYPFQGGTPSTGVAGANPSTGLTAAFWQRIDYFLSSAASYGITIFLNAIGYDSDFSSGPGPLFGKSQAEFQAYGAALGARYAATANLAWHLADDYFSENDALITAFMTGVRSAGDTHLVSIENMPESDSRSDLGSGASLAWGAANAQYNFVYTYAPYYLGVEFAYGEASPVPVIGGDGYFYQGGSTYNSTFDRGFRQDAWWALSSGARGAIHGDEGIWKWTSTSLAQASSGWFWANSSKAIATAFTSLTGWHRLIPDTGSALVTSGRGTRGTPFTSGGGGGQYEPAFTDTYVSASRVPDGSLAVIYLSHATTIGINQSMMAPGYTATWIDPVSGATTAATPGASYNSAANGNNSAGDPDWVLVLQGTPGAATPGAVVVAPGPAVVQAAYW